MENNVVAITIALEVASKQSLFILVAADGTVNRLGTGAVNNQEPGLYIGITKEPLFEKLRDEIKPEWLKHLGAYDVPNNVGQICQLTVLIKHSNGEESGLRFRYGSESQGPPGGIGQFVISAIALTEPWYTLQKSMVTKMSSRRKP